MERRDRVVKLFAVSFIFLVLQYGLVGIVSLYASEPWPAVVLPAFKKVYYTDQTIKVEQARIHVGFEGTPDTSVYSYEFLAPLPRSHHGAFLSQQCRPKALSGSKTTEVCATYQGRTWFVTRARHMFPDDSVSSIRVNWERLQLQRQDRTQVDTTRTLIGGLEVY